MKVFISIKHIFAPALLAVVAITAFSGCASDRHVKASTEDEVYNCGTLGFVLKSPMDRVQQAAHTAITNDLKFTIVNAREDAISAIYKCSTALGKTVTIRLQSDEAGNTMIDITVGVTGYIGDERLSTQVLDAIRARLL
jgi:hypothetical protein